MHYMKHQTQAGSTTGNRLLGIHLSQAENVWGLLPGCKRVDYRVTFMEKWLEVARCKIGSAGRDYSARLKVETETGCTVYECVSNFPRLFRYHGQTSKLSSVFSLPSAKVITHMHSVEGIANRYRFHRGGNLAINSLTFKTSDTPPPRAKTHKQKHLLPAC